MTTIFSETLTNTEDGSRVTYLFDDESEALKEAAADILNLIRDNWDLSDDETRDGAQDIQDNIRSGKYRLALASYNDIEANRSDEYTHFISVTSDALRPYGAPPSFIDFSQYDDGEDEEEEEEEEEEEDDSPYLAFAPGAVCRGPCKNPSADAYADRRDGTFVCYQCKLFGGVFGKTL